MEYDSVVKRRRVMFKNYKLSYVFLNSLELKCVYRLRFFIASITETSTTTNTTFLSFLILFYDENTHTICVDTTTKLYKLGIALVFCILQKMSSTLALIILLSNLCRVGFCKIRLIKAIVLIDIFIYNRKTVKQFEPRAFTHL
ncbi:hypothetical protein BDF14DRAFT_386909 [Spinellus fusiger]|nr:hypothetical protein BDF14DRAFT_386909 [Spinellus fusiger]